jgi:hypothetical protein
VDFQVKCKFYFMIVIICSALCFFLWIHFTNTLCMYYNSPPVLFLYYEAEQNHLLWDLDDQPYYILFRFTLIPSRRVLDKKKGRCDPT